MLNSSRIYSYPASFNKHSCETRCLLKNIVIILIPLYFNHLLRHCCFLLWFLSLFSTFWVVFGLVFQSDFTRQFMVMGWWRPFLPPLSPSYSKANLGITHTESLFAGQAKANNIIAKHVYTRRFHDRSFLVHMNVLYLVWFPDSLYQG